MEDENHYSEKLLYLVVKQLFERRIIWLQKKIH